jgi:Mg2+ and Co2+ transporter CorA
MSIASLSLTTMTCVSGIFGMNLTHGMESEPGLFLQVSYGSFAGSVLLGILIFVIMVLTGVITGIGPVDQDGIDSLF